MFFFFFNSKMKLKSFKIENYKSFQNIEIYFDEKLSVLTGANNCGKTTIIEAIALWVECFEKLITRAKKTVRGRYSLGDYILGTSSNRYFEFGEINSVRVPHFEDIFFNRNIKKIIRLTATIISEESKTELKIPISIRSSTKSRYAIKLENESTFKYKAFNTLFKNWSSTPVAEVYASPIATISLSENFLTLPQLKDQIKKRESQQTIRNRLYRLYHSPNSSYFQKFERDISYILYNSATESKIHFFCKSDINQDKMVAINYKLEHDTVEKDVALLGSGSLQIIEILLNLYSFVEERKDLILILLDEPDSHIHRDMQRRLLEVLKGTSSSSQIIVTTHNESLIRSTQLSNLFHIDPSMNVVKCVDHRELSKINQPHYTGLYPSILTPIVENIGGGFTGLDFISALEADKIVFVEGDDDARLLYCLFHKKIENSSKKIVFWVLGGVTKILDKIDGYYNVFKDIRNGMSLWDKSVVVFDQDLMLDEHKDLLQKKLESIYKIKSCVLNLYTQESVLLTEPPKLFQLLCSVYEIDVSLSSKFTSSLEKHLKELEKNIKEKYALNAICQNGDANKYYGNYIEKMNTHLDCTLKFDSAKFASKMFNYYMSQPVFKLANKSDVSFVINSVLKDLGSKRAYSDTDFYTFAQRAENNTLFEEWEKIVEFLG